MPHIRDPVTGLCVVCDRGKKPNPLIKGAYSEKNRGSAKQRQQYQDDYKENRKKLKNRENKPVEVMIVNPDKFNHMGSSRSENNSVKHYESPRNISNDFHAKSHINTNGSTDSHSMKLIKDPQPRLPRFSNYGISKQRDYPNNERTYFFDNQYQIQKSNKTHRSTSPNYPIVDEPLQHPRIVYVPVIPPQFNYDEYYQQQPTQYPHFSQFNLNNRFSNYDFDKPRNNYYNEDQSSYFYDKPKSRFVQNGQFHEIDSNDSISWRRHEPWQSSRITDFELENHNDKQGFSNFKTLEVPTFKNQPQSIMKNSRKIRFANEQYDSNDDYKDHNKKPPNKSKTCSIM